MTIEIDGDLIVWAGVNAHPILLRIKQTYSVSDPHQKGGFATLTSAIKRITVGVNASVSNADNCAGYYNARPLDFIFDHPPPPA